MVSVFILAGCYTIRTAYLRPDDTFMRPGSTLNAYRNMYVIPLGVSTDIFGVELAVSNELSRAGFHLVGLRDVQTMEEKDRLATLTCAIRIADGLVSLELYDSHGDRILSCNAHTDNNDFQASARLAASYVRERYSGYDESVLMAPYLTSEHVSVSREHLMEYLDRSSLSLAPLEGVWTDDSYSYEVGIFRDSTSTSRDFVGAILQTSAATWEPGQVKAEFRKTSDPGVYRATYYMRDHSKVTTIASVAGNLLKIALRDPARDSQYEVVFTKSYPASPPSVGKSPELKTPRRDGPSVGTGFLVSEDGLVATNYHVVDGIKAIEVYFPTKDVAFDATVMLKDKLNDIALLKLQGFDLPDLTSDGIPYGIGGAGDAVLGGVVTTLGFPLSSVLGQSIKVSSGSVSSLSGLEDDPRLLQISNPIQPGNSGGPLFNKDGRVVGIVVSSLNAKYFYERVSILPQNVNFAVKADYLRTLLAMSPEGNVALNRASRLCGEGVEDQVKLICPFIAAIRER